ncbi:hypothetical protein BC829DRAFT_378782 [Chytridium lagenaria]|nr:hypothetical protein BC829DRAFT_378782 [Chytridium lagenaria]
MDDPSPRVKRTSRTVKKREVRPCFLKYAGTCIVTSFLVDERGSGHYKKSKSSQKNNSCTKMVSNLPPPIDPTSKIYKIPLDSPQPSPTSTQKKISWGKGSNAKFHFTVYAYVSPDIEAAATAEIENMKKDHHEGHKHGKKGHDHHHKDPKKRGEELQKRAKAFEAMLEQLKDGGKTTRKEVKEVKDGQKTLPPPTRRKLSDSRNYDEKPFEMRVGMGFSVPCMEKCVKTMKPGEKARFLCLPEECDGFAQLESVLRQEKRNKELIAKGQPPTKMFGCCAHANAEDTEANKDLLLLVGSPLEFEITLISVQEPGEFTREIWEMSPQEKFVEAPMRKAEGGELYRAGDFVGACEKYTRALMLLESLSLSPTVTDAVRGRRQDEEAREKEKRRKMDERKRLERLGQTIPDSLRITEDIPSIKPTEEIEPDKVYELMNTTRLNYAACKLKLGDLPAVIAQCSEVLKNDAGSVKALFRRAQAYARIGRDLDLAGKDLDMLRKVLVKKGVEEGSAEWVELRREEKALERLLKVNTEKEKRMYGNMFA